MPDDSVYKGFMTEKFGYINPGGEFVIKPQFANVGQFEDGMAWYFQPGTNYGYGFIDKKGEVIIKPEYASVQDFSEGLAAVSRRSNVDSTETWGYIDKAGKWVVEPQFIAAAPFKGGLARVQFGDKLSQDFAYIDKTGAIVWRRIMPE
jgi:hypothetical protein